MNRKHHRSTPKGLRSKALAGAIVAALTMGTAGTAAADGLWAFGPSGQAMSLDLYVQQILNTQLDTADANAGVTGTQIGYQGPADSVPLTVADNSIGGIANANDVDNAISLGALDTDAGGNAGLAILSGQVSDANAVDASTIAAAIGLDIGDYTAGNATVTGNALSATALANDAGNRIDGDLNVDAFDGSIFGSLSSSYDPATGAEMEVAGGVVIGNGQVANAVDASASVTGGDIALVNAMTVDGTATAAPVTVGDNAASAASTLNRASNVFSAGSGGAVSFAGSVGVSNGQAALGGSSDATVEGTDIGAELDDATYQGALAVSGNSLSASAKGNDAAATDASGNLVRGNAIVFADGVDVTGVADGADVRVDVGSGTLEADVFADLAILNMQGTQNTTIDAAVAAGRIGGSVQGLDGGSLSATGNRADAAASGNSAINMFAAGGANFDDGVGVGNVQANDASDISASVVDVDIGVEVTGATQASGAATVGDSAITASATGSSARTSADVSAANLRATYLLSPSVNNTPADVDGYPSMLFVPAGIVVANQQGNYEAGSSIDAEVDSGMIGATFAAGFADGSASVQDNAISATATGNAATTSLSAAGSSGELSGVLASNQSNASDVGATLDQITGFVGIVTGDGDIANATLNVGGNRQGASATANQAGNRVAAQFDGTLVTLGGTGVGSGINSSASAGMVLSNVQRVDGAAVTATVIASQMGVHQGDAAFANTLADTTITVQDNAASATALGNSAGNSLTIDAGSLEGGNAGLEPAIAAIGNLQQTDGDTVASNAGSNAGYYLQGSSTGLNGTVTGNGISAFAAGNFVGDGNLLTVTGTNLSAAGDSSAMVGDDGLFLTTSAAFVVQNSQSSTAGNRTADVSGAYLGGAQVGAGSTVADSTLSVSDNGISADARDNYAVNGLSLEGFGTLATTAAVHSDQDSNGTMGASLVGSGIGLEASAMSGVTLTVSDNDIAAKAVGNTATNTLVADASSLAGNSADVVGSFRGAVETAATGDDTVVSDYSVANTQSRTGSIVNSGTGVSIGASATGGDFDGAGSATVEGNSILVLAQANSAGNAAMLSGSNVDASSAVRNEQDVAAGSTVGTSVVGAQVGIMAAGAMDAAMPLTVTGNSVNANAGFNEATNALSVDADGAIVGNVGLAGASNDSATYAGLVGATADYAVANDQAADGAATSNMVGVQVLVTADGDIGAAGGDSSVTISGNDLGVSASGNAASNSISLDAAGTMDATAALHNGQSMAGGVTASATGVDIGAGQVGGAGGAMVGVALTVDDNRVGVVASANRAINSINASGAVLSGAALNSEAAGDTTAGTSTAIATYALNSVQSNSASVTSNAIGITIGGNVMGGVGALTDSVGTIGGNRIDASASGNTASNSILLAAATGMPSAAIANTQMNSGDITASITGASIGIMANGVSNSPVTVTGNVISAAAVGNSAVNHIGIGD